MAPRRPVRSVKVVNNNNYKNLSLNDVLCPICRCIFTEPVTLPCTHSFCSACFEGTLANANLTCPLCRVRFGSWHRIAKKEQKVVNVPFWDAIKVSFPKEVKNKLMGIEENLEENEPIRLTSPGSIRRDYELQKSKQELELMKKHEAETKASEKLIQKLKEEEEYEAVVREEKVRLDEQVAKQIAKEIGYIQEPSNSNILFNPKRRKPLDTFLQGKKHCMFVYKVQNKTKPNKALCQGKQLQKFVINRNNVSKNGFVNTEPQSNSKPEVTNKNNCIETEIRYFKPIDQVNVPATKVVSPIKVPAKINKAATVIIGAPSGSKLFRHNAIVSAFAQFSLKAVPETNSVTTSRKPQIRKCTNQNADKTETQPDLSRSKARKKPYTPSSRPSIRNTRSTNATRQAKLDSKLEENDYVSNDLRESNCVSPPFYGFDKKTIEKTHTSLIKSNNSVISNYGRKLQEESDLEFAKKLHEELNKSRYCTRNSIIKKKLVKKRRQITLDELVGPTKAIVK